jgi:hypothetical protein
MKMWLPIAFIGLVLWSEPLEASKQDPDWNAGKLTLNDGTELLGDLSYNWKAEIVQIRQGGTLKAYSAYQVSHFTFFDDRNNALRRFNAVDFPVKRDLIRPIFLEEFTPGTLTVYRRLRHTREPIKLAKPVSYNSEEVVMSDYDNFTYYVYADGNFTDMDYFGQDIWPRMNNEFGTELHEYALTRQLDFSSTAARLMLIAHYNYLKEQAGTAQVKNRPAPALIGED